MTGWAEWRGMDQDKTKEKKKVMGRCVEANLYNTAS